MTASKSRRVNVHNKPPSQNTMSTAIEGAFLILLGQTLFGAFAIAFGLIELSSRSLSGLLTLASSTSEGLLYCVFSFALCVVLAVTIVIDWSATREAIYELQIYRNKHFTLDVCIVVVYFTLNNIVFFMSNITASSSQWSKHVEEMLNQPPHRLAFYPGIVYAIFAIYYLLCRGWNPEYIAAKKEPVNSLAYGGAINLSIVLLSIMSVMSFLMASIIHIQIVLFVLWIVIVIYLDAIFIYFSRQGGQ